MSRINADGVGTPTVPAVNLQLVTWNLQPFPRFCICHSSFLIRNSFLNPRKSVQSVSEKDHVNPVDPVKKSDRINRIKKRRQCNPRLKTERLKRQLDVLDRQIDNLVYQLYGLTNEEITIVESGGFLKNLDVHFLCMPKENEPKERAPVPLGPPASGCLHKLFSAAGSKTRCFCNCARSRWLLKSGDGFLSSTRTPLKQFAPFIREKDFTQLRCNGGGVRAGIKS